MKRWISMHAKTIIPAPTVFEKLLTISSSKPYRYFLTHVVVPIRYRFFGPRDPAAFISQIQAASVRAAARETGIDGSPLMLKEPEACPTCSEPVLMFVLPERVCFDCWPDALDSN
jgi:hypothetical protein